MSRLMRSLAAFSRAARLWLFSSPAPRDDEDRYDFRSGFHIG